MVADARQSCYVHQSVRVHKPSSNSPARGEQVATKPSTPAQYPQPRRAKDVHAASIVVVRITNEAKPQPPQTLKPAGFLARVRAELVMQPLQ